MSCTNRSIQPPLVLHYNMPAAQWKEALPIGNGSLGTMVQGNVFCDTLVINEETIWSGGPHDYINSQASLHLEALRQLIRDNKYKESVDYGDAHMIGAPRRLQAYQPLGSLIFSMGHTGEVTDYKRALDLDNALVTISYKCNGQRYTREFFASHPHEGMIMRFTTTAPSGLKMQIKHSSDHNAKVFVEDDIFHFVGKGDDLRGIEGAIKFEAAIQIAKGIESTTISDDGIDVVGAKELVIHYVAASNYVNHNDVSANPNAICNTRLSNIEDKIFKELLTAHVIDHKELFNRVKLNLGVSEVPEMTTDKLVESARTGKVQPYLDMLFYQMSRYLTIASSREGSQPMNLQGIWNDNMAPPWDCKWTLNINLPMNYWMTEGANLSECHEPAFSITQDLHKTGQKVAKTHYACRGFVAHHNTDLWRASTPVDGANWGLWTFGGAWMTRHLWEHYQYTLEEEFLKENYHIMKDASLFFFDYLVKNEKGELVTSPSVSFEQSYRLPNGDVGRLCEAPTMDNQMLRDLFSNCLAAANIVGDSQSYKDSLVLVSNRLRPNQIDGKTGEIMEWDFEAQPKPICGQIAPLWGVNPGCEINPVETPELAQAAITTIRNRDPRVVSYETSGSWMSGTRANFWARLYQGNDAYAIYQKTVKDNLFPNVLVSFYPKKYFMIDGNLGTAAAFQEMLVQSQRKTADGKVVIDLLPALPSAWPNGEIEGLCLRGGFVLDMKWKNSQLINLKLTAKKGGACELQYNSKNLKECFSFTEGECKTINY